MKKNNLWHIIWIISIYATLITILYLVVIYKVKWETKDYTKYLYFYDCGNNDVCTTDEKITDYYSRVECPKDICPRIISIDNNLAILGNETDNYLYDYTNSKIINENYKSYKFSSEKNTYIVKDDNNKYGVIDNSGSIIIDFKYDNILDYVDQVILYRVVETLKIDNNSDKENPTSFELSYKDVNLFTKDKFIYKDNNEYYIANTKDGAKITEDTYDYIYPFKDVLLVFKNSKLDILDINLNSRLAAKIDTYYPYTKEKERSSLNIKTIDDLLRFAVYNGENEESTYYIYDLKHNKLYD